MPDLADRVVIDLLDRALQGEDPPRDGSGTLRLRRVAARDTLPRPRLDLGAGMSRLARALAAGPARSPEQLGDSVLASLGPHARDDIALLPARTTARTAR